MEYLAQSTDDSIKTSRRDLSYVLSTVCLLTLLNFVSVWFLETRNEQIEIYHAFC